MNNNPYIDQYRIENAQRILEKKNDLEFLRSEVADNLIDNLLGDNESDIVKVHRDMLATAIVGAILEYEKRRMAINLGNKEIIF